MTRGACRDACAGILDIKWDGASLVVVLVAILIAVPATAVTLWLYRRAVARAMRASAGERLAADLASDAAAAPVAPLQISAGGDELPVTPSMAASRSAMRGLSGAYALAGFVHSVVTTALWFVLNDVDFRPFRVLLVWLPFAWPVVLGVMLTATTTRAQRYTLTVGYFLVLLMADAGAEVFGLRYQPGFGELFVYWAAVMGLPTLIIALLGNRAWRSVGLVALFLGLAISASLLFGFQALGCLTLTTRSEFLLTTFHYLLAALVLGSVLLAGSWLKRSYQAKRMSDQMLVLDGWWLLVTLLQLLFELGPSGLFATAFLLSYVAYKVVLRTALPRVASASSRGSPPSLLLLRVFGYTRRTRGLIDQVGQMDGPAAPGLYRERRRPASAARGARSPPRPRWALPRQRVLLLRQYLAGHGARAGRRAARSSWTCAVSGGKTVARVQARAAAERGAARPHRAPDRRLQPPGGARVAPAIVRGASCTRRHRTASWSVRYCSCCLYTTRAARSIG